MILKLIVLFVVLYCNFKISVCENGLWQMHEKHINKNREELVVQKFETHDDFVLELNITRWRSMSLINNTIAIGFKDNKMVTVEFNKDENEKVESDYSMIDMRFNIIDARLYKSLNERLIEALLIVASNSVLKWYKVQTTSLRELWTVPLPNPITFFEVFVIDGQEKIILLHQDSQAAIYNFSLREKSFWLDQYISLKKPSRSAALVQYKWDHFLALTQENCISVFKRVNNNFVSHANISTDDVDQVVTFEIGFKSFLAVNGLKPAIYQFVDDKLLEETVDNSHTKNIEFWMVLPISEYRDEAVLLAQRSLHHGTHNSSVIDLLTYNGQNFIEHEDIPCTFFGEERSDLTCLIDSDAPNNLLNVAHLTINEKLFLLVPSEVGHNTMFNIKFDYNKISNPLLDELDLLESKKIEIEKLINTYKLLPENEEGLLTESLKINTAEELDGNEKTGPAISDKKNIVASIPDLEQIKQNVTELGDNISKLEKLIEEKSHSNKNSFDKVIIQGPVNVKNANFKHLKVNSIKNKEANNLFNNIVRKNDLKTIPSTKVFSDIKIGHLNTPTIAGTPVENMVIKTNNLLEINGNVFFNNDVNTTNINIDSGLLNNKEFQENIVLIDEEINDSLHLNDVVVSNTFNADKVNRLELTNKTLDLDNVLSALDQARNTVFIPENVTVKNINGEDFNDFLNELCLINIKCYIRGDVKIDGNIFVEDNAYIEYLNNIAYPGDYIFTKDSVPHLNLTGKKNFTNLQVGELKVQKQLNGIHPNELITLSSVQSIPGTIQFDEIEVLEEINIHGDIIGKDLDKFLSNPILSNTTNTVNSKTNFKKLRVEGAVILSSVLNNKGYEFLLDDIIYKDSPRAQITGIKDFSDGVKIKDNLEIISNKINGIDLNDFITKNTDQTLNIKTLKGNVGFENIYLTGLYGPYNVTKIDQESVKLTGEQYISSILILSDAVDVKNLAITNKLNDFTADQYLYATGDREITNTMQFESVNVDFITVEENVIKPINNLDLDSLQANALSYTKDQKMTGSHTYEAVNVNSMDISNVNDKAFKEVFDSEPLSDSMKDEILNGNINIENLHVHGSINVSNINNRNIKFIITGNSTLPKDIAFEDEVFFNELEIEELSAVNFKDFLKNIVFKNELDVEINGEIEFSNNIKVKNLLETDMINGMNIKDILTKFGQQKIERPIIIHGDVYFEDVNVTEKINDIEVDAFDDSVNINDNTLTINGDVVFERFTQIMNLSVLGHANGEIVKDLLENLVYRNKPIDISKSLTFEKSVNINGNLAAQNFNNLNLTDILPNIVLITKDANIRGPIKFTEPTFVLNYIQIEESLKTKTLFGVNIENWKQRAIFTNKGLLQGSYEFNDVVVQENILVENINNIDMNIIIPLRLNQTISSLFIKDLNLLKDVNVGGLISGLNIAEEMKNVLTNDNTHEINSEIVFQNNVLVRNSIFTPKINDLDVSTIITTDTDQNLTARYDFQMQCSLQKNMDLSGLINGIEINEWNQAVVKHISHQPQDIMQPWTVSGNMTLQDVDVEGDINGIHLEKMQTELTKKINHKLQMEKAIIDDYNNLCKDVENTYELSKQQIYKFRYFDELQVITLDRPIKYVYHFKFNHINYLLVHEEDTCESHLMTFSTSSFASLSVFQTGPISQIIPVSDGPLLYLVSRGSTTSSCPINGTNIWTFVDEKLELISILQPQLLLQESLVPRTFYGLDTNGVTEYKINGNNILPYRKWDIFEENIAFVPRGLATGLTMRTGEKLYRLAREDFEIDEEQLNPNVEVIIKGKITEEFNHYFPGRFGADLTTATVSMKESKRTLLAVASHEDISVKEHLDIIKIYSDPIHGKVFHKLSTYKPSSLMSLEFGNGETLLAFLENKKLLQLYEYKGINGFKHRQSAKLVASKLFQMNLPVGKYLNERKIIGAINGNKIILFQAVMSGNQVNNDLTCKLQ